MQIQININKINKQNTMIKKTQLNWAPKVCSSINNKLGWKNKNQIKKSN